MPTSISSIYIEPGVYTRILDVSLPAAPQGILFPALIGLGSKSLTKQTTLVRGQIDVLTLSVAPGLGDTTITITVPGGGTIVRTFTVILGAIIHLTTPLANFNAVPPFGPDVTGFAEATTGGAGSVGTIVSYDSFSSVDNILSIALAQVIAIVGNITESTGFVAVNGTDFTFASAANNVTWVSNKPKAGSSYVAIYIIEKQAGDYTPQLFSNIADFQAFFGPAVKATIIVQGTPTAGSTTSLTDTTKDFNALGVQPGQYVRFDGGTGLAAGNDGLIRLVLSVSTTTSPNDTINLATIASGVIANPFGPTTPNTYTITDISNNTLSFGAGLAFVNGAALVMGSEEINDIDSEFTNALNALINVDPYVIVPMRGFKNVAADTSKMQSIKTHVLLESSPTEKHERIALLGGTIDMFVSTSQFDTDVTAIVNSLKTNRIAYLIPPIAEKQLTIFSPPLDPANAAKSNVVTDPAGITVHDGSFFAAALSGIVTNPLFDEAEPITRKPLTSIDAIEYATFLQTIPRTDKNVLAGNGTFVIEEDNGGNIFVRHALTTDNSTPVSQELKVTRIADVLAKDLRVALLPTIGTKDRGEASNASIANVVSFVLGIKIENTIILSFRNLTVKQNQFEPREKDVSFQIKPDFDIDWIVVTFGVGTT